jgi:phosphate transport system permease protein
MTITPVERPGKAAPWANLGSTVRISSILASVLPAVISLGVLFALQADFMAVLITFFLPLQLLAGALAGYFSFGRKGIMDGLLLVTTFFFASFVLVLLISVIWSVVQSGFAALSPQFIFQNNRYITGKTGLEIGGVGHAILGSVSIVGLTTLIAVPLGVFTAVYLTETRDGARGLIRTLLQAMSGLPSVVAGLFIYSMLIVSGFTTRVGIAGSLALIPLMLPTIARVAEEALRLVPVELRNGALALGAPSYKAFFMVTLPAAQSGIITAVLLGVARVIGETAPLILTTLIANETNVNLLEGGMATLPTYIYNYISLGDQTSLQRAWGAALVLLIFVGILFVLARLVAGGKTSRSRKKKEK